MDKYGKLHLWMILPFLVMQLGIFEDYWGDFTDNAWSVHVHYWTGTAWYLYLIVQPYYATHGQLARHRTNGIIGMFLAGGVCLTALSMMHRDVNTAHLAAELSDRFGPFEPWFFYGVAAVEIPMMIAFGLAVIMSIIQRKRLEDHAWWLITTVFLIMMPALARGIQNVYVGYYRQSWPDIDIMPPIYLTQFLIVLMVVAAARYYRKLNHPATFVAIAVNLYACLIKPLGQSFAVQAFFEGVVKG